MKKDISETMTPGDDIDVMHHFSDWEPGHILLGQYQVKQVIGVGGMGKVYLVQPYKYAGKIFAVKTLKEGLLEEPQRKRRFINELSLWMDLPDHPHFTSFHFFKTIENRLTLFLEYVDGGSLEEWISNGKLLTIEKILDVAIQFAWALQAVHDQQVIHQDIKPKNILMTSKGIVKITDFGLAQAMQKPVADSQNSVKIDRLKLPSCGATISYCSPEQAENIPLTCQSDIWSYGVSILQMFTGEVKWQMGCLVFLFFNQYQKTGPVHPYPVMPESVKAILNQCFEIDPLHRWKSMDEIGSRLVEIYQSETGKPYFRHPPERLHSQKKNTRLQNRRMLTGVAWKDPREFYNRTEKISGIPYSMLQNLIPYRAGSRKVHALTDLEIYEEILRILSECELTVVLGKLLMEILVHKAFIHEYLDDMPGALDMYDTSVSVMENLRDKMDECELEKSLVNIYINKGVHLYLLGDYKKSIDMFDISIGVHEKLQRLKPDAVDSGEVAKVYMNKAVVLSGMGQLDESLALYSRSIELFKTTVMDKKDVAVEFDLSKAYMNKANLLVHQKRYQEALNIYHESVQLIERLILEEGQSVFEPDLATVYMNKAVALALNDDHEKAVAIYEKSIELLEKYIRKEGRHDLEPGLAKVYSNQAYSLDVLGYADRASAMLDESISVLEKIVFDKGKPEFANELGKTYLSKSDSLQAAKNYRAAVQMADKSIDIYTYLIEKEGQHHCETELARAMATKGCLLNMLGYLRCSIRMLDKSIAILDRLVTNENRSDLSIDLAHSLIYRAETHLLRHQMEQAQRDGGRAIGILQTEFQKSGYPDVQKLIERSQKILDLE